MQGLDKLRSHVKWVDIIGEQITDPIKFRRLNGWLVIFWAAMIPISILTGLVSILAYVTILSLYANFATHLGAWAASRAEAKQVEVEDARIDAKHAEVEADEVSVHKK